MNQILIPIVRESKLKILMVCLGNICRSPLAHGIMQQRIDELQLNWEVDSAGTSAYHAGEAPDQRSILEAKKYDIDIHNQRSRQITLKDISYYDIILVMDSTNRKNVLKLCKNKKEEQKVHLIMDFSKDSNHTNVPDPYYENGFDKVYNMLESAIDGFISHRHKTIAV